MIVSLDPKKALVRRSLERLLDGARNADDLHKLMFWLRTRSFGHSTIKEIGDGIAHFDERNQGIVFQRFSDTYHAFDYLTRRETFKDIKSDKGPDKASLTKAVEASMRWPNPAAISKMTWLGQARAFRAAKSALSKLDDNAFLTEFMTLEEERSLRYLSSILSVPPAITQAEVASDLAATLLKNKLCTPEEADRISPVAEHLCAYAAALMHQTLMPIADGVTAKLYLGMKPNEEGATLYVISIGEIKTNVPLFGVSTTTFETDCRGEDWCSEELLRLPRQGNELVWEADLEMNPNGIIELVR